MSDERDDLLKEIGDLLGVEPSPSFAAGVRTRIASEPSPRRAWMTWFVWGGAASAVAASVAVIALMRPGAPSTSTPATTLVVARRETPVVAAPAPAVIREPVFRTSVSRVANKLSLEAPVQDAAPEVLTTQGAALIEMWSRVLSLSAGPVTTESSMPSMADVSAAVPLPELKELTVEPIVIAAVELPGLVLQGAVPVIRRVTEGAHR